MSIETKSSFEKSQDLSKSIVEVAKKNLEIAIKNKNLKNFLQAEQNLRDASGDRFQWIFDLPNITYTKQNFFNDKMYGNTENLKKKEERIVKEMYQDLKSIDFIKSKSVPISLRRFRIDKDNWKYRVLAHFPEGSQIIDPKYNDGNIDNDNEGFLYYKATVACANHACDVLYKQMKNEEKKYIYLPYISPQEFWSGKVGVSCGTIEFQDPKTGELRNPETEVMRALVGSYTNLNQRYRIPYEILENNT